MGGNVYTQLPYVVDAERCFNLNINRFAEYQYKLKNVCQQITIVSAGHDRVRIVPAVPEVPMCHVYLKGTQEYLERGREHVKTTTGAIVFDR
jgi:hypothetical protein